MFIHSAFIAKRKVLRELEIIGECRCNSVKKMTSIWIKV